LGGLFAACAAWFACSAAATEGGGNNYPIGVNTVLAGLQPPPGNHGYLYLAAYEATSLKNNNGDDAQGISNFSVHAQAAAVRLSHVWRDVTFLGANLETRVNIPFVNLDLHFDAQTPAGVKYKSGHATGLSDMTFAPVMLGWHTGSFHQVAGLEFFLPTGSYDKNRLVNPGRHYYSVEPTYAFTWFPTPNVELSARALYMFNTTNHATDYHSGQEFIVDYNAAVRMTHPFQVGVSGYYYRQTTDDTQNGSVVNGNGNRGQVLAVGPFFAYVSRKIAIVFKYQRETLVRNRPEGNRFWIQAYMPFE
jgi:hypothetical protein